MILYRLHHSTYTAGFWGVGFSFERLTAGHQFAFTAGRKVWVFRKRAGGQR